VRLIVYKSLRRLEVHSENRLIARFGVSLGFAPIGKKLREGDGRTPEGEYRVAVKNPKSRYLRSLGLDYPNPSDAVEALCEAAITEDKSGQSCLPTKKAICRHRKQNSAAKFIFTVAQLRAIGQRAASRSTTAICFSSLKSCRFRPKSRFFLKKI